MIRECGEVVGYDTSIQWQKICKVEIQKSISNSNKNNFKNIFNILFNTFNIKWTYLI